MDGAVVRLGALHVREGAHRTAEPLLEPELRERDLARGLVHVEVGERPVADAVALDADPAGLELRQLVPVERRVDEPLRGEVLLVGQRPRVVEVADRDEDHRRIAVAAQDGERVLEDVPVAVVERDQHGARRQRPHSGDVVEHGVERDDLVAELAEHRHLLVEEADRHRDRVLGAVVDLVVHEHAQRAVAVAVDGADRRRGLADRPVEAVLQQLLGSVGTHDESLGGVDRACVRSAICVGVVWLQR